MKNLKFLVILSGLLIGVGAQAMCPFRLVNYTPNIIQANIGKARELKAEDYLKNYSTVGYKEIEPNGNSKCFYKGRLLSSTVHIYYKDESADQGGAFYTGIDDLKGNGKFRSIDWDNVVVIRPGRMSRETKLVFFGIHLDGKTPVAAAYSLSKNKGAIKLEALGECYVYDAQYPTVNQFKDKYGIPHKPCPPIKRR